MILAADWGAAAVAPETHSIGRQRSLYVASSVSSTDDICFYAILAPNGYRSGAVFIGGH